MGFIIPPTRYVWRQRTRIAFREWSEGPLVVLLHGIGVSGLSWLDLPPELAREGLGVIAVDNRGTGHSDAPDAPMNMAAYADDLAAVIAGVDRGPAVVVGLSFGGMVAQHVALRHPAMVAGLVLGSTFCGAPYGRLASPRVLVKLLRATLARSAAPELMFHERTLAERPDVVAQWEALLRDDPCAPAGAMTQLTAILTHAAGFRLASIRCPTAVVTGDRDALIPRENAEILARRIPGARLTVVADAGHGFPLEHPGVLRRVVTELALRAFEGGASSAAA